MLVSSFRLVRNPGAIDVETSHLGNFNDYIPMPRLCRKLDVTPERLLSSERKRMVETLGVIVIFVTESSILSIFGCLDATLKYVFAFAACPPFCMHCT